MAISVENNISFRLENDKKIIGLFKPFKILKVIEIVINNLDVLIEDIDIREDEIEKLPVLKNMLQEAAKDKNLIKIMWSY